MSAKYDYREEMRKDIMEWLADNRTDHISQEEHNKLYQELRELDCITGWTSGSRFYEAWPAGDAVAHNWDLLAAALDEYGYAKANPFRRGEQWCDVLIRCYLLGSVLYECVNEWNRNHPEEDIGDWETEA